ncbi:hypothetical protein AB0E27_28715 [Streptomyces sparsogenes]|uniref:hypothetical protein n=1 Tax=Streptomyces sparsogenes TaxID=67365 RepID=UPI0033F72FC3
MSTADAPEAMLRSLNVAPERIPAGTDAPSVLLRSELACRKILLLLDNARDSDQVRCLIPGGTRWSWSPAGRSCARRPPATAHGT